MSLVEDEQAKLTAAALNGVAVTAIAVGAVTQLAALTFAVPGAGARGAILTVIGALAWLGLGGTLHVIARRFLRLLQP